MNPLLKALWSGAQSAVQWSAKNPAATRVIARSVGAWYRGLKPHEKQQVHAILRKGSLKLAELAVGDYVGHVAHWAGSQAARQGLDRRVVLIVERGVHRVAEVGIERVAQELERA